MSGHSWAEISRVKPPWLHNLPYEVTTSKDPPSQDRRNLKKNMVACTQRKTYTQGATH